MIAAPYYCLWCSQKFQIDGDPANDLRLLVYATKEIAREELDKHLASVHRDRQGDERGGLR